MYWIAFGDVHEDTGMLTRIPGLEGAAGVIVSGDLTNRGTEAAARRVLGAIAAVNPTVYAQIGNMDTQAVSGVIDELGTNLHRQVVNLGTGSLDEDVCVIGAGMSTFTPFSTPSEVSDETLGGWLDQLLDQARCRPRLAVIHDPPHGSGLDLVGGNHVGSRAVRAFLERARPEICVTGHIHEAVGTARVGETLVLNPGMLGRGGFVRIELSGGRLSASLERV